MRYRISKPAILASAVFAVLLAFPSAHVSAQGRGGDRDWTERMTAREEINQHYDLAPGARVSVTGVAGPVTVETGSGNRVEIHILRMAESQRELDCYQTEVRASRSSVEIEHVQ